MRIRKGDQVHVIAGKDRGKRGRVLRVEPGRERVFVEGLNMLKRHTRAQQAPGMREAPALGGVIEREGPIHVSNVMLADPKGGKPTRLGVDRSSGKPVRVARRSGTQVD
ncbi:MAG: 50S ribosomal protein L24 [Solirubrobacteraceae bacterium]